MLVTVLLFVSVFPCAVAIDVVVAQEQRYLLEAAFTSLEYYMEHHKEHSKPWLVRCAPPGSPP